MQVELSFSQVHIGEKGTMPVCIRRPTFTRKTSAFRLFLARAKSFILCPRITKVHVPQGNHRGSRLKIRRSRKPTLARLKVIVLLVASLHARLRGCPSVPEICLCSSAPRAHGGDARPYVACSKFVRSFSNLSRAAPVTRGELSVPHASRSVQLL